MGSFHRRVEISVRTSEQGDGEVRAVVEDDFHHLRVRIGFDDDAILRIEGEADRVPFRTCSDATSELARLCGMRLSDVASTVMRHTDAKLHCTHLLDLAGLAIATAKQRVARRVYVVEVVDPTPGGEKIARIRRNDGLAVEWTAIGTTLVGPPPYSGLSLREGFAHWALSNLDRDTAEAAIILRRATAISIGRERDLDAIPFAIPRGRCFTEHPARAVLAHRNKGTTLDFSGREHLLCANDRQWLAF